MQESAVHQHSRRPAAGANAHRKRQIWITRHGGPGRVRQVRRDDRIEIVDDKYSSIPERAVVASMRSRGHVNGIVRITLGLFRRFEYLLTVVNHLLRQCALLNAIRSANVRMFVCVSVARYSAICALNSYSSAVNSSSVYANTSPVSCPRQSHRDFPSRPALVPQTLRPLIARNPASVVAVIEKAHIASDPRALECAASRNCV